MVSLIVKTEHLNKLGKIEEFIESYHCSDIPVKAQAITVFFSLTVIGNEAIFSGDINGNITLECWRCLEDFVYNLNIKINQVYPLANEEIDLSDEIRQLLLLNFPVKPLCKTNCEGLCPKCGQNLNIKKCVCSTDSNFTNLQKLGF